MFWRSKILLHLCPVLQMFCVDCVGSGRQIRHTGLDAMKASLDRYPLGLCKPQVSRGDVGVSENLGPYINLKWQGFYCRDTLKPRTLGLYRNNHVARRDTAGFAWGPTRQALCYLFPGRLIFLGEEMRL